MLRLSDVKPWRWLFKLWLEELFSVVYFTQSVSNHQYTEMFYNKCDLKKNTFWPSLGVVNKFKVLQLDSLLMHCQKVNSSFLSKCFIF